jgi:hypothetical protein
MSQKKSQAQRAFDAWANLTPEGRDEFATLQRMYQQVLAHTANNKPKTKRAAGAAAAKKNTAVPEEAPAA